MPAKEMDERKRQRKPIPRRFPLESFPDGQGGACGPLHWIFPRGYGGFTKDGGTKSEYFCGRTIATMYRFPVPAVRFGFPGGEAVRRRLPQGG